MNTVCVDQIIRTSNKPSIEVSVLGQHYHYRAVWSCVELWNCVELGRHTCALCCSPKNVGQCQITELYSMPARGCAGNGNVDSFLEMDTVVLR